jgi:tetratricopeptide (TPR) repeat protein
MRSPERFLLVAAVMALLGAASAESVEDWIRQGNEAFYQRQLEEALEAYERGEDLSQDPGLIAYNKGVVHFHLGHFREAELHFRRCLEDAAGVRRAQALYGLGNSLVAQGRDRDVRALKGAIRCYQLCREQDDATSALRERAAHNLEVARLLLAQALANPAPPQGSDTEKPKQNGNGDSESPNGNGKGDDEPGGSDPSQGPKYLTDADINKAKSQGKLPVRGNPPVIPDDGKLVPIPVEDTTAYLEQLVQRLQQEYRQSQSNNSGPVPGVKDW